MSLIIMLSQQADMRWQLEFPLNIARYHTCKGSMHAFSAFILISANIYFTFVNLDFKQWHAFVCQVSDNTEKKQVKNQSSEFTYRFFDFKHFIYLRFNENPQLCLKI